MVNQVQFSVYCRVGSLPMRWYLTNITYFAIDWDLDSTQRIGNRLCDRLYQWMPHIMLTKWKMIVWKQRLLWLFSYCMQVCFAVQIFLLCKFQVLSVTTKPISAVTSTHFKVTLATSWGKLWGLWSAHSPGKYNYLNEWRLRFVLEGMFRTGRCNMSQQMWNCFRAWHI